MQKSPDDKEATALLLKIGNAPKDALAAQRRDVKAQIRGALEHVVGGAIAKDTKYAQQLGTMSRSYKASGAYMPSHFDMHLPINLPEGFFDLIVNDHKLPTVNVQIAAKKSNSLPRGFDGALNGQTLSASRIKEELRKQITTHIDTWNRGNGQEYGTMKLVQDRPANPISISMNVPNQPTPIVTTITPILIAGHTNNWAALRTKIIENTSAWTWPLDPSSRAALADDVVLVGAGEQWRVSNVIVHKQIRAAFNDWSTFKPQLYKAMKQINKKVWAPVAETESYHIASHVLLQVFMSEIARSPTSVWSNHDQILPKFKSIMSEFRARLAAAQLTEYAQLGELNHLHGYKSASFLNPTLGSIVRRVEATQKDSLAILRKVDNSK